MPDVYATATLINGLPTVVFVSQPFSRVILNVFANAATFASATIYRGINGTLGGLINAIGIANPATYNVPFKLPAGQALYVVFSASASPVSAASARISASREW
jgi:hypothetical protein